MANRPRFTTLLQLILHLTRRIVVVPRISFDTFSLFGVITRMGKSSGPLSFLLRPAILPASPQATPAGEGRDPQLFYSSTSRHGQHGTGEGSLSPFTNPPEYT